MAACDDCPDANNTNEVIYVVYTGGPPHAPFALMGKAIPSDGIIRQYQPKVHEDGRVEYESNGQPEPPVPEGYDADSNPFILLPVWCPCVHRMYRVQMLDNGLLEIKAKCVVNPATMKAQGHVTNEFCQRCRTRLPI
jgi:hypothetical protein